MIVPNVDEHEKIIMKDVAFTNAIFRDRKRTLVILSTIEVMIGIHPPYAGINNSASAPFTACPKPG